MEWKKFVTTLRRKLVPNQQGGDTRMRKQGGTKWKIRWRWWRGEKRSATDAKLARPWVPQMWNESRRGTYRRPVYTLNTSVLVLVVCTCIRVRHLKVKQWCLDSTAKPLSPRPTSRQPQRPGVVESYRELYFLLFFPCSSRFREPESRPTRFQFKHGNPSNSFVQHEIYHWSKRITFWAGYSGLKIICTQ